MTPVTFIGSLFRYWVCAWVRKPGLLPVGGVLDRLKSRVEASTVQATADHALGAVAVGSWTRPAAASASCSIGNKLSTWCSIWSPS